MVSPAFAVRYPTHCNIIRLYLCNGHRSFYFLLFPVARAYTRRLCTSLIVSRPKNIAPLWALSRYTRIYDRHFACRSRCWLRNRIGRKKSCSWCINNNILYKRRLSCTYTYINVMDVVYLQLQRHHIINIYIVPLLSASFSIQGPCNIDICVCVFG